jgi:hypothetical protein
LQWILKKPVTVTAFIDKQHFNQMSASIQIRSIHQSKYSQKVFTVFGHNQISSTRYLDLNLPRPSSTNLFNNSNDKLAIKQTNVTIERLSNDYRIMLDGDA